MVTTLFADSLEGTFIVFDDKPRGEAEVRVTVAHAPFGKLTMTLDLDEVDRLLAVREHAVDPVLDIAEHFSYVHHAQQRAALLAAKAFVASAGSLAETVR